MKADVLGGDTIFVNVVAELRKRVDVASFNFGHDLVAGSGSDKGRDTGFEVLDDGYWLGGAG